MYKHTCIHWCTRPCIDTSFNASIHSSTHGSIQSSVYISLDLPGLLSACHSLSLQRCAWFSPAPVGPWVGQQTVTAWHSIFAQPTSLLVPPPPPPPTCFFLFPSDYTLSSVELYVAFPGSLILTRQCLLCLLLTHRTASPSPSHFHLSSSPEWHSSSSFALLVSSDTTLPLSTSSIPPLFSLLRSSHIFLSFTIPPPALPLPPPLLLLLYSFFSRYLPSLNYLLYFNFFEIFISSSCSQLLFLPLIFHQL